MVLALDSSCHNMVGKLCTIAPSATLQSLHMQCHVFRKRFWYNMSAMSVHPPTVCSIMSNIGFYYPAKTINGFNKICTMKFLLIKS